jgi:pullulanase/glycogen debranching enzyme
MRTARTYEISWYEWATAPNQDQLAAVVAYLCQLRKAHPNLLRRRSPSTPTPPATPKVLGIGQTAKP